MTPTFKIYVVGGAVRDALMGLPVKDRDYVVVGATPEQIKAAGFIPVGKDFPVFLHPDTHEEYALARTERKTAPGYTGFVFHASPEVTLEQDLQRRDLTINAIAQDISKADAIPAADIVKLLERCDAFRKADRFKDLLTVHKLIHQLKHNNNNFLSVDVLEASLQVAKAVNAGQIAASVAANNPDNPTQPIASAVHDARVNAVQARLNSLHK